MNDKSPYPDELRSLIDRILRRILRNQPDAMGARRLERLIRDHHQRVETIARWLESQPNARELLRMLDTKRLLNHITQT